MEARVLLVALGHAMASGLLHLDVPRLLVQQWEDAWSLLVVDQVETDMPHNELVVRLVQGMTHARELCRLYGRE